MSIDYAALAATGSAVLKDVGQALTLRRVTQGAYDSSTGKAAQTSQDYTRYGAVFEYDTREGAKDESQQSVLASDKTCLMEASGGIVPQVGTDFVIASGVQYSILAVGEINPAGTPVLYKLHLRR